MIKSVCVYCGSTTGARAVYTEAAKALGRAIVAADMSLVYGGGRAGLMGLIADEVLANGGRAVGVIPELLLGKEVGHTNLTELHVVPDMHERKRKMADMSDAFVAMPGGIGTFEELFETYTWAKLGYHRKPVALLNVDGYYEPLLAMLRHTVDEGFMRRVFLDMLQVAAEPVMMIETLKRNAPALHDHWAERRNAV
jgi:uncharacterized protein (TIGR00730 family)